MYCCRRPAGASPWRLLAVISLILFALAPSALSADPDPAAPTARSVVGSITAVTLTTSAPNPLAAPLPPDLTLEPPDDSTLRTGRIDAVGVGDPGVAWGTEAGLFLVKPSGGMVTWTPKNSPLGTGEFVAFAMRGNEIWTSIRTVSTSRGLFRWDGRAWITYRETRNALLTERVSCLHCDYDDYVWIGFDDLGVSKFVGDEQPLKLLKEFTVKKGIIASVVQAVFLQGTHLWIGTQDGICRYRLERESMSGLNVDSWKWGTGLPARSVSSLAIIGDAHLGAGHLLAGTERGLALFDGSRWVLQASGAARVSPVNALAVDGDDVWVAGFNGLQRWRNGVLEPTLTVRHGLPANEIRCIAIQELDDGGARIHIGTANGAMTLHRAPAPGGHAGTRHKK